MDQQGALAQAVYRRYVVRDEEHRPAVLPHVFNLAETLTLECDISDGQDLVDDEDLWLEVRGHRER